jgi:hypothetical protein
MGYFHNKTRKCGMASQQAKRETLRSESRKCTEQIFNRNLQGIKETSGRGEFKYDIWYVVRTFVNATMYP